MKSVLLYGFFCFFSIQSFSYSMNLDYIRNNYELAVSDKQLCKNMIDELSKLTLTSIELAYFGALQTIWTNHISNPFTKLTTFKKGKSRIEAAVRIDSDNIEIRFIRLSIQKNCPSFLGYNNNIKEDQKFLQDHKGEINSLSLMKLVNTVLKK